MGTTEIGRLRARVAELELELARRETASSGAPDRAARVERIVEVVREHLFAGELRPDGSFHATFSGPGFERLLGGVDPSEPVHDDAVWQAAVHADDRAAFDAHGARIARQVASEVEYRLVGRDGQTRWVRERAVPHPRGDGVIEVVGIVIDISRERAVAAALEQALVDSNDLNVQLELARAEASRAAATDALTGVGNRRAFEEAVAARWADADPAALGFAIVMVDVDHFKRINDTSGHGVGDAVLVQLARRLEAAARPGELVARWGGEEFIVALFDVHDDDALRARAGVLHGAIGGAPFELDDGPLAVTGSLGAARQRSSSTLEALIADADRALYAAKRRGRDRVVLRIDVTERDGEVDEPESLRTAQMLAAVAAARSALPALRGAQVDETALRIARELELGPGPTLACRVGAWLHDIGLLAATDDQLARHRRGEDEIRAHAVAGELILARIPSVAVAAPTARSHHERYDGAGYPDGLAGDAIPLPARVVSVAAAYVTALSAPARAVPDVLDALRRERGRAYDPDVVDALVRGIVDPDGRERRARQRPA